MRRFILLFMRENIIGLNECSELLTEEVLALKRVEMNKLTLDDKLAPGEIRELTDEELKLLQV